MTLIFTTITCSGGKLPACTGMFSIKTSQISFQTRQTATYQHHSMYGQFFRSVSCSSMRVSPFNQHERRHSVSPSRSNVVIHLHVSTCYLVSLLSLYLSTPRGGSVQRVFPKSHRFNLLLTHFSVRLYKLGSEGEFVLVADLLVWPKNKQKWNKCTFFFFSPVKYHCDVVRLIGWHLLCVTTRRLYILPHAGYIFTTFVFDVCW